VIRRKLDAGEFRGLGYERDVTPPELENGVITWNSKMSGSAIDGVQKSMPDPEVNESENEPVGDRLQRSGLEVICHAGSMTEKVRQPSGLNDPDQRDLENPASHGNCEVPVAELIRQVGITEQTLYRWKKQYKGLETDQVRQFKQLQEENGRLKRLVAELTLDKVMLQDVLAKKL
jgi:putative transposase